MRLPSGVESIRTLAAEHEVQLVVIDPITAHLDRGINPNSDVDVRVALQPLAQFAAETGVAVVLVRHRRKADGDALLAGAGSMAFAGVARSVLLAAKDPTTRDCTLAVVKSSVSATAPSLSYRIVEVGEVGVVEWLGVVNTEADDLTLGNVDERTAVEEACNFLRQELKDGWLHSKTVKERAEAANISLATLRRADSRIGVLKRRGSQMEPAELGDKTPSNWYWRLPEPEPDAGAGIRQAEAFLQLASLDEGISGPTELDEQHEQVLADDGQKSSSDGQYVVAQSSCSSGGDEQVHGDEMLLNGGQMSN